MKGVYLYMVSLELWENGFMELFSLVLSSIEEQNVKETAVILQSIVFPFSQIKCEQDYELASKFVNYDKVSKFVNCGIDSFKKFFIDKVLTEEEMLSLGLVASTNPLMLSGYLDCILETQPVDSQRMYTFNRLVLKLINLLSPNGDSSAEATNVLLTNTVSSKFETHQRILNKYSSILKEIEQKPPSNSRIFDNICNRLLSGKSFVDGTSYTEIILDNWEESVYLVLDLILYGKCQSYHLASMIKGAFRNILDNLQDSKKKSFASRLIADRCFDLLEEAYYVTSHHKTIHCTIYSIQAIDKEIWAKSISKLNTFVSRVTKLKEKQYDWYCSCLSVLFCQFDPYRKHTDRMLKELLTIVIHYWKLAVDTTDDRWSSLLEENVALLLPQCNRRNFVLETLLSQSDLIEANSIHRTNIKTAITNRLTEIKK
jgi:hypothetical protein